MRKPIKRVHYKIRSMYDYAQEKGISILDLTEEEVSMFEGRPMAFYNCVWPLSHKEKCFICETKTGYVDKFLTVYVCKEECMREVDKRYNLGEEIPVSKVAEDILERVSRDLEY